MDKSGVCFLHAPLFNPAMKNVGPVRKSLRVKTFFNMLGPMVNPSFPQKQMIGVFSLELARLYNYLYQHSGKEFAIVHTLDGYDEISLTSSFKHISNLTEQLLFPEDIGFASVKQEEIHGGSTVPESAGIFMNVLEGKGTRAQNDVVLANAALGLKCYYKERSLDQCLESAKDSLFGKKALKSLQTLIEMQ